ncbi:MAG: SDR family oxidoreductase [Bdellovibrionota bacterium]
MTAKSPLEHFQQKLSLAGKKIIVTGGASGIGKCAVKLFASAGASVAIVDFDKAAGAALSAELSSTGTDVRYIYADVAQQDDCENALRSAHEAFGSIDVLVTCAGIVRPADSNGNSVAEMQQMFAVNFFGTVHFVQGVLPLMSKSGRIVCVGSIAGETMVANRDGYCASKAALHAWAAVRAPELRRRGITLNVVAPGRVLTELVRGWLSKNANPSEAFRAGCATQCSGTMLLPEAIAEMVYLLASNAYPVAGTVLDLSDGWGQGYQGNPANLPESFDEFKAFAKTQFGMALD